MHYTEYNQVCSKCDRPIEYKELGRSILITPCPCQVTKLVEALEEFIFLGKTNMTKKQVQLRIDIAKQALANATK